MDFGRDLLENPPAATIFFPLSQLFLTTQLGFIPTLFLPFLSAYKGLEKQLSELPQVPAGQVNKTPLNKSLI